MTPPRREKPGSLMGQLRRMLVGQVITTPHTSRRACGRQLFLVQREIGAVFATRRVADRLHIERKS